MTTTITISTAAFFRELDIALTGAGYRADDVSEIYWSKDKPNFLTVKLMPDASRIYVEITTHSIVLDHRPPPDFTPPSQATHALVRERPTGPGHRVTKKVTHEIPERSESS
jgi:hypothetical protein